MKSKKFKVLLVKVGLVAVVVLAGFLLVVKPLFFSGGSSPTQKIAVPVLQPLQDGGGLSEAPLAPLADNPLANGGSVAPEPSSGALPQQDVAPVIPATPSSPSGSSSPFEVPGIVGGIFEKPFFKELGAQIAGSSEPQTRSAMAGAGYGVAPFTKIIANIFAWLVWYGASVAILFLVKVFVLGRIGWRMGGNLLAAVASLMTLVFRLPVESPSAAAPVLTATSFGQISSAFISGSFVSRLWLASFVVLAVSLLGYVVVMLSSGVAGTASRGASAVFSKVGSGRGGIPNLSIWILPALIGVGSSIVFLLQRLGKPEVYGFPTNDLSSVASALLLVCAVFIVAAYSSNVIRASNKNSGGLSYLMDSAMVWGKVALGVFVGSFFLVTAVPSVFLPIASDLPVVGKFISQTPNALFFYRLVTGVLVAVASFGRIERGSGRKNNGFS